MRGSANDVPAALDIPGAQIRWVEWGGMTVENGKITEQMDITPLFKGLPNDRCQCPHWGYVIKGQMRFLNNEDQEEVFDAGDFYYVAPNHLPTLVPGLEYVEYSLTEELAKTMEVVDRNMASMMPSAT